MYNPKYDKLKDSKFFITLWKDTESYNPTELLNFFYANYPKCAFALHDSDLKEDGTPAKLHYHCFVKLTQQISRKRFGELFGISNLMDIEYAVSEERSVRYLIHIDNDNKHHYDIDNISSNYDISRFFPEKTELFNVSLYKAFDDFLSDSYSRGLRVSTQQLLYFAFDLDATSFLDRHWKIINSLRCEYNDALLSQEHPP